MESMFLMNGDPYNAEDLSLSVIRYTFTLINYMDVW